MLNQPEWQEEKKTEQPLMAKSLVRKEGFDSEYVAKHTLGGFGCCHCHEGLTQ